MCSALLLQWREQSSRGLRGGANHGRYGRQWRNLQPASCGPRIWVYGWLAGRRVAAPRWRCAPMYRTAFQAGRAAVRPRRAHTRTHTPTPAAPVAVRRQGRYRRASLHMFSLSRLLRARPPIAVRSGARPGWQGGVEGSQVHREPTAAPFAPAPRDACADAGENHPRNHAGIKARARADRIMPVIAPSRLAPSRSAVLSCHPACLPVCLPIRLPIRLPVVGARCEGPAEHRMRLAC